MIYILILVLVAAMAVLWLVGKRGSRISERDKARVQQSWSHVQELLDSPDEHAWSKAVLEADKLMDFTLGIVGVRGKGLGEKLKVNRQRVSNLDAVWTAHKLRNQLAHELNMKVSNSQARQAVNSFGSEIRKLGLI